MIIFENIEKKFGKTQVLQNINLALLANKSYALLGPNGSGKTTLIKCILGMVKPTSGNLLFNQVSIGRNEEYRRNIGYMPQIGQYPQHMTIRQIFDMMKDLRKKEHLVLDEELMELYKIKDIEHKKMGALSGGTKQKVSACLAFLFRPDVIILDEPTAGLDPVSSAILKAKIKKETNANKLLIITSHILSDLDEIVTDLVYLQDGVIVYQKPIAVLSQETGEFRISNMISSMMLSHKLEVSL